MLSAVYRKDKIFSEPSFFLSEMRPFWLQERINRSHLFFILKNLSSYLYCIAISIKKMPDLLGSGPLIISTLFVKWFYYQG